MENIKTTNNSNYKHVIACLERTNVDLFVIKFFLRNILKLTIHLTKIVAFRWIEKTELTFSFRLAYFQFIAEKFVRHSKNVNSSDGFYSICYLSKYQI